MRWNQEPRSSTNRCCCPRRPPRTPRCLRWSPGTTAAVCTRPGLLVPPHGLLVSSPPGSPDCSRCTRSAVTSMALRRCTPPAPRPTRSRCRASICGGPPNRPQPVWLDWASGFVCGIGADSAHVGLKLAGFGLQKPERSIFRRLKCPTVRDLEYGSKRAFTQPHGAIRHVNKLSPAFRLVKADLGARVLGFL